MTPGYLPVDYPVATAKTGPGRVRELPVEFKVGRFTARARNEQAIDKFLELVVHAANESLEHPTRLLSLPHLRNAVAQKLVGLQDASKVLLDGFISELMSRGSLRRLTTLNRDFQSYQAIHSVGSHGLITRSLDTLRERLRVVQVLTLEEAKEVLPRDLTVREQNVFILMGALLYEGTATTDAAPSVGFESIRLPYAQTGL